MRSRRFRPLLLGIAAPLAGCMLSTLAFWPDALAAPEEAAPPTAGTDAPPDARSPQDPRTNLPDQLRAGRYRNLDDRLVPPPAAVPAPEACYRAATTGDGDAYDCDLAVQMARDSGSRAALAAALTNRALVLTAEGRLEPALADLDAALAATPDSAAIHGNRGNLLLRLGRPAEALAAYDRAAVLAPRDPTSYYNRAFGHLALGDPGSAEQDVAAARELLERGSALRPAETSAPDANQFR